MPELRAEAEDWFYEACVDLAEARDAKKRGRNNWACFAAQQAAEKALKAAYLTLKRKRFPKTHDLTELYSELKDEIKIPNDEKIALLSAFYEIARYPNAGVRRPSEAIKEKIAEEMINLAHAILKTVGEKLGLKCPE